MADRAVWDTIRRTLFSWEAVLYVASVILAAIAGWFVASPLSVDGSSAVLVVELECVLLVLTWIVITFFEGQDEVVPLPNLLVQAAVAVLPVALMFSQVGQTFSRMFFWATLLLWCLIAIREVLSEEGDEGWMRGLQILGVVWTVSGAIITIGTIPFLGYAENAVESLHGVSVFLELRILLGTAFIVLLVATAFCRALQERLPNLPTLVSPRLKVPDASRGSVFEVLIAPFAIVFNVIFLIMTAIADVIYKVITLLAAYLIRIGKHAATILLDLLSERGAAMTVLRLIAAYVLVLILSVTAVACAKPAIAYIRSGTFLPSITDVLKVGALVILVMVPVGAGLYAVVTRQTKRIVQPTAFGLAMVVTILFFAGSMLHVLRRFPELELARFAPIGPFTIVIGILLMTGFITLLCKSFEPPKVLRGSDRRNR